MASSPNPSPALEATYTSPTASKTFSYSLPSLNDPPTTAEKTAYLATLRESVTKLQEEVNTFLTAKMEEDKVAGVGGKVDEKREEENYGEEGEEEGMG